MSVKSVRFNFKNTTRKQILLIIFKNSEFNLKGIMPREKGRKEKEF